MSYKIILLIFFHLLATSFSFGQTKTTVEEQAMMDDSILVEKLLCANEWYACMEFDSIPQIDSVPLYNENIFDIQKECTALHCFHTSWKFETEGYDQVGIFGEMGCPNDPFGATLYWDTYGWEYDKVNKLILLLDYDEKKLKFILEIIHLSEEKLIFKVKNSF